MVEAVGDDVTYVKPGDHVITCLSVFCGECEYCTDRPPAICARTPRSKLLPGAARRLEAGKAQTLNQAFNLSVFAEQMLVHEHAVVKIAKDMPLDRAALVGCGVMTGVGAVFNTAKVEPGSTVAVIGCGGIGLSAVNGAALAGASRIIAIDTQPPKLDLARRWAPPISSTPPTSTRSRRCKEHDRRRRALLRSRRSASRRPRSSAFAMLRPGGTATIIGMIPFGTKIELHGADFLRDRKIQGTSMGGNRFRVDMPRLLELYVQGRLKLDHMISGQIKLERDQRGLRAAEIRRPGAQSDRLRRRIAPSHSPAHDRASMPSSCPTRAAR